MCVSRFLDPPVGREVVRAPRAVGHSHTDYRNDLLERLPPYSLPELSPIMVMSQPIPPVFRQSPQPYISSFRKIATLGKKKVGVRCILQPQLQNTCDVNGGGKCVA